jgi:hypothetical protein
VLRRARAPSVVAMRAVLDIAPDISLPYGREPRDDTWLHKIFNISLHDYFLRSHALHRLVKV